jgi:hypothetical protein
MQKIISVFFGRDFPGHPVAVSGYLISLEFSNRFLTCWQFRWLMMTPLR